MGAPARFAWLWLWRSRGGGVGWEVAAGEAIPLQPWLTAIWRAGRRSIRWRRAPALALVLGGSSLRMALARVCQSGPRARRLADHLVALAPGTGMRRALSARARIETAWPCQRCTATASACSSRAIRRQDIGLPVA